MSREITLSLIEAQRVVKTLSQSLHRYPSNFVFRMPLQYAQFSSPEYKVEYQNEVKKMYDSRIDEITEFMNCHDDMVKLKTLISDTNASGIFSSILV